MYHSELPSRRHDHDTLGWARQMKGRKLLVPKVSCGRVTCSEWLAQSTKTLQAQRTKPKQLAKAVLPTMPSSQASRNITPAGKSAAAAEVITEEVPASLACPVTTIPMPSAPSRPISQELSRRRQLHPRMRWPRLASRENPHAVSREGLSTNASELSIGLGETCRSNVSSTGMIVGYDEMLEEKEEESEFEDFLRSEMTKLSEGIIIGDANILFEDMEGQFTWPWENGRRKSHLSSSMNSRGRHPLAPDPLHIHSRMSLLSSATDFSFNESGGLSSSSSSILPRAEVHEGLVSGTTATIYSTQAQDLVETGLTTLRADASLHERKTGLAKAARDAHSSKPGSHSIHSRHTGLAKAVRGATSAEVQDDKWFLRQAPMSFVTARTTANVAKKNTSSSSRSAATPKEAEKQASHQAPNNKAFNFENWGVDDAYICSLCNTTSQSDFNRMRRLNLSDNRLTAQSIQALTTISDSLSHLKICNFAGNHLGEQGGLSMAKFLQSSRPKLMELDLSGNQIGDYSCVELCEGLIHYSRGLKVLALAGNGIGQSDSGGTALGQLLQELGELTTLDLHWNALHGIGGTALCAGLYENNTTLGGQLRRFNVSWNRLGLRCEEQQVRRGSAGTAPCSCSVCMATSRTAKMLASVFQEGKVLFHLDLSYNGFCANMCTILADGLRRNHTLFGIHLVGNEASIDDQGFIRPNSSGADESEKEQLGIDTNRIVRNVPGMVRKKFAQVSGAGFGHHGCLEPTEASFWGSTHRNVQKCWICENWVEHSLSYVVGFSGPEESVDEVTSISCYFSIDGWSTPTPLTRTEEIFQRRLFEGKVASRHLNRTKAGKKMSFSNVGLLKECIPKTDDGKIVRWVGSRVLPPSSEPIEVVFQVNNKVVATDDLQTRHLAVPKLITIDRPATERQSPQSPQLRRSSTYGQSSLRTDAPAVLEVKEVNVLSVALSTLERFEQGMAVALCVLEDPGQRGEIAVYPRKAANEPEPKAPERWKFETSSFKDFNRDTDATIVQCFENDWKLSRLQQIIKSSRDQEKMCTYLGQRYKQVMAAYHHAAFTQFVDPNYSVFIGMTGFSDLMRSYDHQDKNPSLSQSLNRSRTGWLFDGKTLLTSDVDNIYVASNVHTFEEEEIRKYKALPARGLARFQFLEAFVRIVLLRFYESGEKEDPALAMQEFLKISHFGEDIIELRKTLHLGLFTEECCLVYRENKGMLEALYESYKRRANYPGRPGKGITYGSWLEMMQEADAFEGGLSVRDFGAAFALAKEIRVDEIICMRHMELSYAEFLVALAAVVRLRSDFEMEFFADMLSDFMTDFMTELYNKDLSRGGGNRGGVMLQDASLAPIIGLVARLFEDADEDNSGTLTIREFKRCINQPQVQQEVQQLGIQVGEFNVLFRSLDSDRSGEVTLDEFCQGFIKMKMAMRGMTRAIAYFRRVIEDKDEDQSGSLNLAEFQSLCRDANINKKMQALGIETEEIETLFEEILADNVVAEKDHHVDEPSRSTTQPSIEESEVHADHVISAFIRMRDPSLGGKRAMNFLRQVFIEADADNSGSLTRAEVRATFMNDRVSQKLRKLGLKVPDWMGIFDALDLNFDGELSWEELNQGVTTLWEADIDQRVQNVVEKRNRH